MDQERKCSDNARNLQVLVDQKKRKVKPCFKSLDISTMSANKNVLIILDRMDQAETMMPHFYYVCKYVYIYEYNNRCDGPS